VTHHINSIFKKGNKIKLAIALMSSRIIISIRKVLWLYEGYGEEGFGGEVKSIENVSHKIAGGLK